MHSFEVSLGHESVDRTTFSTWSATALHWKCTSVNAFIPQWNFKRMHSILKWMLFNLKWAVYQLYSWTNLQITYLVGKAKTITSLVVTSSVIDHEYQLLREGRNLNNVAIRLPADRCFGTLAPWHIKCWSGKNVNSGCVLYSYSYCYTVNWSLFHLTEQ